VKEVPVEKTDSNNLAVALRLSVPVLVAPVASAAPNLVWQVQRADDGGLTVGVHNTGNMHAKVRDFGLLDSGDQPLTQRRQVMSYVLAGESQQWRVDGAVALAAGTPVVLDSQGDGKSRRHPLTVQ
jgi:fimbrial chaperone protein